MLRTMRRWLERAYVELVTTGQYQRFNNAVLRMALRARGYGNTGTPDRTGESFFLARLKRENVGLCIDVGANRGDYSALLLESSSAVVLAFEPLPEAYRALEALSGRYPGRIYPVNKGVGDADGELELHWGYNSQLATFSAEALSIDYVARCNVFQSRVPVTTLDSYLEGEGRSLARLPITLLKVDTEGFEYEVLSGARNTLLTRPPKYVQLEFNTHQLYRERTLHSIARLLRDYTPYQMLPGRGGLYAVSADDPLSNVFAYSNFVFQRKSESASG